VYGLSFSAMLRLDVYEFTVKSSNCCPIPSQSMVRSQFVLGQKEKLTFAYYGFPRPSCKAAEEERSKLRDLVRPILPSPLELSRVLPEIGLPHLVISVLAWSGGDSHCRHSA
jgi:hypothetical protein